MLNIALFLYVYTKFLLQTIIHFLNLVEHVLILSQKTYANEWKARYLIKRIQRAYSVIMGFQCMPVEKQVSNLYLKISTNKRNDCLGVSLQRVENSRITNALLLIYTFSMYYKLRKNGVESI